MSGPRGQPSSGENVAISTPEEVLRKAKEEWHESKRSFAEFHDSIRDNLRFSLSLEHYNNDTTDKALSRIKPRGEEQFRRIRYKAGEILKTPFYFECKPVDEVTDPETAEVARQAIEWEITNPIKRFDRVMRGVVWGALSTGMWAARVDFDPDFGPFGELLYSRVQPDRIGWHPDFDDPHDPSNPFFWEECVIPLDRAQKMRGWKNADKLVADDGHGPVVVTQDNRQSLVQGSGSAPARREHDLKTVTVIKMWYRRDTERTVKTVDTMALEPDERYMACTSCGYQSATQAALGFDLPEVGEEPCPECNGGLERIDAKAIDEVARAHQRGHRLVIFAPFSPLTEPLRDGGWPTERPGYTLRTYPYLVWRAYEHPTDPMGMSETSLSKTQMLVVDAMMRMGYEQMREAKPLTILPLNGLVDAAGQPFAFRDAQGTRAFYTSDLPPQGIQHYQSPGLNPAWASFYNAMVGTLKGNEGSSDLGLSPQNSKDIAVGTLQLLTQSGNIPIDDHKASLWMDLSLFFGVILDMVRATYTDSRAVRMFGDDGKMKVELLKGADIPNMDVVVTNSPTLSVLNSEQLRAFKEFASAPPQLRRSLARLLSIPPQVVREIEEEEQKLMQMQSGMSPGGARPGGMGGAASGTGSGPPQGGPTEAGGPPAAPAGAINGVPPAAMLAALGRG